MNNNNLYTFKLVSSMEKSIVKRHIPNWINAMMTYYRFERDYTRRINCANDVTKILDVFKKLFKEYYYIRTTIIPNMEEIVDPLKTLPMTSVNENIDTTINLDACRVYMSYNQFNDTILVYIMLTDGRNFNVSERELEVFKLTSVTLDILRCIMHSILRIQLDIMNHYRSQWKENKDV